MQIVAAAWALILYWNYYALMHRGRVAPVDAADAFMLMLSIYCIVGVWKLLGWILHRPSGIRRL